MSSTTPSRYSSPKPFYLFRFILKLLYINLSAFAVANAFYYLLLLGIASADNKHIGLVFAVQQGFVKANADIFGTLGTLRAYKFYTRKHNAYRCQHRKENTAEYIHN